MTVNDPQRDSNRPSRRSARLRLAGVSVLLAGMAGAGIVYWLGTRSPDVSDDLSMVGFNRAERRQMGQLYGNMGTVIEDWSEDLKRPGTQAILIAGFSAAVAAGCFYVARLLGNDDKTG
ncbi:MAG: hypothetical protein ACLQAH_15030 [Limisphaerales bacterium]